MKFKILFTIFIVFLVSCEHYDEEPLEKRTIATNEKVFETSKKNIVDTKSTETTMETKESVDLLEQYEIVKNDIINEETEERIDREYSINENIPSRAGTPELLEELNNLVVNKEWTYGMSPVEWVYIPPNVQIVSNYKPNSSNDYSIRARKMSGERGCYMPVLSKTEMLSNDYDGRLYCFDDYKKIPPTEFRFKNSLNDLKYSEMTIEEILSKAYDLTKTSNGLLKIGDSFINVVYVTVLDDIIATLG